jgi:pyruvate/2-oxoglutarate dehydrogenase complex dihydrolipoamide acyltransferase (E2) component
MVTALRAPRINSNDDSVRLTRLLAAAGTAVHEGDIVAEISTDKAIYTVEAGCDGYVVGTCVAEGEIVSVGGVIAWLASTADERPPLSGTSSNEDGEVGEPTLKARTLLLKHGLDARAVPRGGRRLRVADVESYLAATRGRSGDGDALPSHTESNEGTRATGRFLSLNPEERAMLRAVSWHQTAVPAYVELFYDPQPWRLFADHVQDADGMMLDPLLSLMALRLVDLVGREPRLNSTILGERRLVYDRVNLGFAVHGRASLYLAVLRDAGQLTREAFCTRMGELQRRALTDSLRREEVTGATIAFSSMARWHVSRHVPILPAYTTVTVSHAVGMNGEGVLGATYDHRNVAGGDVALMLQQLSRPPEER